jgi:hypothetical protein
MSEADYSSSEDCDACLNDPAGAESAESAKLADYPLQEDWDAWLNDLLKAEPSALLCSFEDCPGCHFCAPDDDVNGANRSNVKTPRQEPFLLPNAKRQKVERKSMFVPLVVAPQASAVSKKDAKDSKMQQIFEMLSQSDRGTAAVYYTWLHYGRWISGKENRKSVHPCIKPSSISRAGFGLFAEKDYQPGDILLPDIREFGQRIRFEMEAPADEKTFCDAADVFLRNRWHDIAWVWNKWFRAPKDLNRWLRKPNQGGWCWDADFFLSTFPVALKHAFVADEHAQTHPYVAGTQIVKRGNTWYEDFYDPFLSLWGFINHRSCGNLEWAYSKTKIRDDGIPMLELRAKVPIRKGEEFSFNYGPEYGWSGRPAEYSKTKLFIRNEWV